MKPSTGHLFIVNSDITKIACDAWMLPSSWSGSITSAFCRALGETKPFHITQDPDSYWKDGNFVLHEASHSDRIPDLWIGNIGHSLDTPIEVYSKNALDFIRIAASRVRERRGDSHIPVIAVNVFGSGRGGKKERRGELVEALVRALHQASSENSCDVVLVTYDRVMFSAANASRRRFQREQPRPWSVLPPELKAVGDVLAARARKEELVIFMGAGVSQNAGLPSWMSLLENIADDMGLDDGLDDLKSLDPRDQATLLHQIDPRRFKQSVTHHLKSDRFSLLHALLASLPANEFVTTNFDSLFESACQTADGGVDVIPGDILNAGQRWLLKLHGTLGRDLILTRGDFLGSIATHAALRGIVQALLMTKHMLFVGYSLGDEDFHQLVHEVRATRVKDSDSNMGTVILLHERRHLPSLWPELNFVSADLTGMASAEESSRNIAILMDYVACESTSQVAYVSDKSYGDLRDENELELFKILNDLGELLARVDSHQSDGNSWTQVRSFLEHFKIVRHEY